MNGLVVEDFIMAIAAALEEHFPDYRVWDDIVQQNSDESGFFVQVVNVCSKRVLGSRFRRDYDFDVAFYPRNESTEEFYMWQTKMQESFDLEDLKVGEGSFHIKDTEIENVGGVWHYTFAVSFFVQEIEQHSMMGELELIQEA